jgi:hypothetical protein
MAWSDAWPTQDGYYWLYQTYTNIWGHTITEYTIARVERDFLVIVGSELVFDREETVVNVPLCRYFDGPLAMPDTPDIEAFSRGMV